MTGLRLPDEGGQEHAILEFLQLKEPLATIASTEITHPGSGLICRRHDDLDPCLGDWMRTCVIHQPAQIVAGLDRVDPRAGEGDITDEREGDVE